MYSPFVVVKRAVPNYEFKNLFDVGANDGSTAVELARTSDKCRVFAFEPVESTYLLAQKKCSEHKNIQVFCLALGAQSGVARMITSGPSVMNRISDKGDREVAVHTLDEFCRLQGIDSISYLKIDTEGNDLNVLRGASRTLGTTDFVEVEASMNDYNQFHVGFDDLRGYMKLHKFGLLHIFEQILEMSGGGYPIMRRANLMFVSPRIYGSLAGVTTHG